MKNKFIALAVVAMMGVSTYANTPFEQKVQPNYTLINDGKVKEIGTSTGVLFSLDKVEYITFVPVKNKEIGKRLTKITYPLYRVDKETPLKMNSFVVSVYDQQKQLIYTKEVVNNAELVEVTLDSKEFVLPKEGYYVGIKYIAQPSVDASQKIYDFYYRGDTTYKYPVYYNFDQTNNNWQKAEEINKEEFKEMYSFATENKPMLKKKKNLSPVFQVEIE